MINKRTIFITSIGGDVASAALRCIVDFYQDCKLIGCDIDHYVQGKMYVDEFVLAPSHSEEEKYINFIKRVCQEYNVTHFLPISENEILIASKMRSYFQEKNIYLLINNDRILEIGTNKYKTFLCCKKIGVPMPDTFMLSEVFRGNKIDTIKLPVIIKNIFGYGAKGNEYIYDMQHMKEYLNEYREQDCIVQSLVGNVEEEYTMGVFSDGKAVKSIVFKRRLGFGSMSIRVETIKSKECEQIAYKIAKELNLVGCINVQMRKENGIYYVFEINPRISSSCSFRHMNGFKDVIWWIQMMENNYINSDIEVIEGSVGVKILDEIIFSKEGRIISR